nr:hypothetical protein BaRGS_003880 [Batillaria attramentaria]
MTERFERNQPHKLVRPEDDFNTGRLGRGGDFSGNNEAETAPSRTYSPTLNSDSNGLRSPQNYTYRRYLDNGRLNEGGSFFSDERSNETPPACRGFLPPVKYDFSDIGEKQDTHISDETLAEMNKQNNNLQYERRAIRLGFNPPIVYDIVPPPLIPKQAASQKRLGGRPRLGKEPLRIKTAQEIAKAEEWRKKKERWTRAKPPMSPDCSEYEARASGSYFAVGQAGRNNSFPWFPVKVESETQDKFSDKVHLSRYPTVDEFRVIKDDYGKFVVHLTQQPSPIQVTSDRALTMNIGLPGPHTQRGKVVSSRENHGGFRWHRPAFQPFQLKPWVRDLDFEEELRSSLAVYGPSAMADSSHRVRRPDRKETRTAQSNVSVRDLLMPATKRSVATFPARPPISRGKQIPGRFFPKPTFTDEQKAQIEMLRRNPPPPRKASSLYSVSSPTRKSHPEADGFSFDSASVSRMDRQNSPSYNQRIVRARQQLHHERPELRSEVFAICFKHDLDGLEQYDPNSELHSDYYTIKRLRMPAARLGRRMDVSLDNNKFAVVLRGHRKHLHNKFILSADDTESLIDSFVPRADGGSATRRIAYGDDRESSPRKIIAIETPKADEAKSEVSGADGDREQEHDKTLAPLNSPTGSQHE